MGRFHAHEAAVDEGQRSFLNYIGDRSDVTDGEGHTANVGGNYKNYYRNGQTGTRSLPARPYESAV